jgi:hypothetical protein
MIREEECLVIYLDGIGRFPIPFGVIMATIMGLGEAEISGSVPGVIRLSESGRGLYLDIGEDRYVTPVARVRAVLSGEHRKGPVSRVR